MSDYTQQLARWLSTLTPDSLPADVEHTIKLLALDTFTCALTGAQQTWAQIIQQWAGQDPRGQCDVWSKPGLRLRANEAALVNGCAAHGFELDDFHNAKLHPGAVVLPAAIAIAQQYDVDPARLPVAIAAGYEIMIRSSLALSPAKARMRGWHLTAVCGPLGAAAAAAVLLQLDAQHTAWALGLAGTQSSGLFAFTADGTDSKRFHPGRAAQSGVIAAELASQGLSGPTQLYEAQDGGWLHAFSDASLAAPLVQDLGQHWHAMHTNFKPYACCGSAHPQVDAALALRERWQPSDHIRVGAPEVVLVQCGYRYTAGSVLNAQMSLRYSIAIALLEGQVLQAQFEADKLRDPALLELANALELVHDTDLDTRYPAHFCGWIELVHSDGRVDRVDVLDPSGSSQNTQRPQAIRSKTAAQLAELGWDVMTSQALEQAFTRLGQDEVATIMQIVTSSTESSRASSPT